MLGIHMHVHTASLIVLAIVICGILSPVASGAGYKVQYDAVVQGTVHINSDHTGAYGDNVDRISRGDTFQEYSSGDVLLSAPGYNDFSFDAENDANVGNRFVTSDSKNLPNGGVFSNTLSTMMSTPNVSPIECTASAVSYGGTKTTSNPSTQWTDAEAIGITSGKTQATTSKFVNGANTSFSQQAAWDGAGFHTGRIAAFGEVGGNNSTDIGNYEVGTDTQFFTSSNGTKGSGGISRVNFEWTDYRDSFVANVTNTTNANVSVNQT